MLTSWTMPKQYCARILLMTLSKQKGMSKFMTHKRGEAERVEVVMVEVWCAVVAGCSMLISRFTVWRRLHNGAVHVPIWIVSKT